MSFKLIRYSHEGLRSIVGTSLKSTATASCLTKCQNGLNPKLLSDVFTKQFSRTLTQCVSQQNVHRYHKGDRTGKVESGNQTSMLYPTTVLQLTKRNAGHSHWQNVRHIKAAKDAIKSKNTNLIIQKMRAAIKENGNVTDPKLNSKLASVIEEGKKADVPNAKMLDFLKKMAKNQDTQKIYYFEGKGPGNVLLIFQVLAESQKLVKNNMRGIYKRFGGLMGDRQGFASYGFDFKGIITVSKEEIPDLEKAMDIAIESEAEEVTEIEGEDGTPEYQFTCDATQLFQVMGKIKKMNVNVKDAAETYIPKELVTITPEVQEMLSKLFDKLDYVEEIVKVYDNIKVEDET